MKKLLNFSTHPGDPEMFGDDWSEAGSFLYSWGFDGFELYPVENYPFEKIPSRLIEGIHLRFFIFLREIWQGDEQGLLNLFGSWKNVEHFFGGRNRDALVSAYTKQLDLAERLGCSYVVFHPVDCAFSHIYDWKFPYHWSSTFDICAEMLNLALKYSNYTGLLLFENLWWPGSFTMEDEKEYLYLLEKVDYEHCGIVLDTSHMLNSCGGFNQEDEGVDYLLGKIEKMGPIREAIRTVHLNSSLSGDYIKRTRNEESPLLEKNIDFWERFRLARNHVSQIDPHLPFTNPRIGELFDLIEPDNVVFEFTFNSLGSWQEKIQLQKNALSEKLWG